MAQDPPQLLKARYSSDPQVQRFCEVEAMDFNPTTGKSARAVFAECRARYTDARCLDLIFYQH
jgi:hypothetical protein